VGRSTKSQETSRTKLAFLVWVRVSSCRFVDRARASGSYQPWLGYFFSSLLEFLAPNSLEFEFF